MRNSTLHRLHRCLCLAIGALFFSDKCNLVWQREASCLPPEACLPTCFGAWRGGGLPAGWPVCMLGGCSGQRPLRPPRWSLCLECGVAQPPFIISCGDSGKAFSIFVLRHFCHPVLCVRGHEDDLPHDDPSFIALCPTPWKCLT